MGDRLPLPDDEHRAGTMLMDMTRETGQPPFWAPTTSWGLPDHVRKREVAVAIITEESFKMGFIELKYHDGTVVSLRTKDLHYGDAIMPGEITQKWLMCKPGERDLRGVHHEKGR